MNSKDYEYDVFISYSVEDKISIVTELVDKLKDAGIKVWYAAQQLQFGKDINETIKEGIHKSKHGLIIVSPNYIQSEWTKRELHVLWAREHSENSLIFSVWHNIKKADVEKYDPNLKDNFAIQSDKGIDHIVRKLVKALKDHSDTNRAPIKIKRQHLKKSSLSISIILILLMITSMGFFYFNDDSPSEQLIKSSIIKRIETQNEEALNNLSSINTTDGRPALLSEITDVYENYINIRSQYRNQYYFNTINNNYKYKKYVEPIIELDLESLSPYDNYGFKAPRIYFKNKGLKPPSLDAEYTFINTQPVDYSITGVNHQDTQTYNVYVGYENYIRTLTVHLTYSRSSDWIKKRQTIFSGIKPHEVFTFTKQHNEWVLARTQ